LISVRFGGELAPWTIGIARPYVSAAILPTMILTSKSTFDDGINDTGFPWEVGGGTLLQLYKSIQLNLGAQQIFGTVRNSNLSGFGVSAAIRTTI
jgi:hypothetical protein